MAPPKKKLQPLKRARRAEDADLSGPTGVPVPAPDERKVAGWEGGGGGAVAASLPLASKRAASTLRPLDSPGPSSQLTGDDEDDGDLSDDENIAPVSPGQLDVAGRDYLAARRKAPGSSGRTAAAALAAGRAAWADLLRAEPAAVADAAAALEAGPPPRADEKAARAAALEAQFPAWREWQRTGASVFLYGFGSKRALLDAYAAWVPTGGVLVVDGGAPGASARATVLAAARALGVGGGGPGAASDPSAPFAAGAGFGPGARRSLAGGLAAVHACPPTPALTLAVHGLDRLAAAGGGGGGGAGGPTADAAALASLASAPAVRLIATVDHVNAPLLWDAASASAFAWRWVDATTLAPYSHRSELSRLPPLDPSCAGGGPAGLGAAPSAAAAAAGALSVLASLVPHARAVFGLVASACLAPPPPGHPVAGIAFDDLFRAARARFLASSEAALRGHVGEFRDHGLVVSGGRWGAGGELLAVPLGREALELVLEGLEAEGVWGG